MGTSVVESEAVGSIERGQDPPSGARDRAAREKRALAEIRAPVNGTIRFACVLGALGALAGLVPFVGLAELADTLLAPGETDSGRVWMISWLVIAGLVARAVLMGIAFGLTHFADLRLQTALRRRMVRKLGRVPLGWFSGTSSGAVRKAAQDDVHDFHHLVAHHSVEFTAAVVLPLGGLGYLVWLDWRLALLALATLPFYVGAYGYMMRGATAKMQQMNESQTRVSAAIVEFASGIAVVKTFGQARRAHESYRRAASDFGHFYADWVRPMLRTEAIATMLVGAPMIGLVGFAGTVWFADQGWVTPVEGLTGVLVSLILLTTVNVLGYGAHNRRTAAAAALRIHELLETPELPAAEHPRTPEAAPGQGLPVEFDEVTFSYDGETDVLREVRLTCAPGTVTALVGPSGSGKSTLATLVPRFHDVTGGAVRIGGVDVRDVDPTVLYRNVGFVLQDVQLVHGTVGDNIRLGRPDADEDAVLAAARAARIHDRITALPRGYDSMVGDEAVLSGGEAQRVSIARALLADAPVLVLDEATAFADPESEAAIQDALSTLVAGRTVLVIAHRLHSVTGADRIVVLDDGRIVEQGTHPELLAAGGAYARMWAAQEPAAREEDPR